VCAAGGQAGLGKLIGFFIYAKRRAISGRRSARISAGSPGMSSAWALRWGRSRRGRELSETKGGGDSRDLSVRGQESHRQAGFPRAMRAEQVLLFGARDYIIIGAGSAGLRCWPARARQGLEANIRDHIHIPLTSRKARTTEKHNSSCLWRGGRSKGELDIPTSHRSFTRRPALDQSQFKTKLSTGDYLPPGPTPPARPLSLYNPAREGPRGSRLDETR